MYPINLALKELPSSPTVTFTVRLLVLAATVVFWIPSGAISSLLGNWSTGHNAWMRQRKRSLPWESPLYTHPGATSIALKGNCHDHPTTCVAVIWTGIAPIVRITHLISKIAVGTAHIATRCRVGRWFDTRTKTWARCGRVTWTIGWILCGWNNNWGVCRTRCGLRSMKVSDEEYFEHINQVLP